MFDESRNNLILLILNIIALGNFSYPPQNQSLIILIVFIIVPLPYAIKTKMRTITLLSLVSSFMTEEIVCQVFCIIALGLAVNTAYQIDLTEGPAFINAALGLSQILSFWSKQYLQKNTINRDITLLVFTLPNLFLSSYCQTVKTKALFLINPFLDDKWLYSGGFILSIFTTNLIPIEKHYKFFIIAVFLLIEACFLQNQIIVGILSFLRGLLVYTEQKHQIQKYFLMTYLFFTIFLKHYLLHLMFLGYLMIAVIILIENKQKQKLKTTKKDESIGTFQIQNQMYEMSQIKNK